MDRRESEEAGIFEKFKWDVEHGGLTPEERTPLAGKTPDEIDEYFQNGDWPNHRAKWKQAFKNYLKRNKRHSVVHERKNLRK